MYCRRPGFALPALCVSAAFLLEGCVLPDQVARMEKDLGDVQQQVAKIEQEQSASSEKLAAIGTKLADADMVKRSDLADLRARMEEVLRQVTALDERINQSDRRIERLSQEVQVTRDAARRSPTPSSLPGTVSGAEAAPRDGPPTAATPSPEALYNQAYADFSKGNYSLAISGFEEYADRFSESDLADNALYWVGECLFSQGDFAGAVKAFDRLLEKYPRGDRAAAANLKKGLAFLELNQVGQAIVQLRYVVSTYPESDEARLAKDKLASLGKPLT